MAGLYVVVSWLVVQVVGALAPMFGAPDWVARTVVLLLAVGFLPALLFAWVYEITPEGLKRESEIDRHESITPQTGQRMDRAIVALLVLAVGIFAVDRFVLAPRRAAKAESAPAQTPSSANAPAAGAEAPVSEKSIAVLPLANASDDKAQQYFSDGLSENLIVALSQFEGLAVIGRNSSFQFRDSKEDSKAIGAKLGVAHLLEGSVQRAGDVVRITAELISTSNGHTLWSQRFDRPYQDLFALQDEITSAVASALKAKLLVNASSPPQTDRPPGGSLEAYSAYLQGRFHYDRNNEEAFRTAIQHYESAVRLDPRYAVAFADMSRTWSALGGQHLSGVAKDGAFAKARAAVASALQLDPNLAAAHMARGNILRAADFDWAGAEAEYRKALEINPNDSRAKFDLGRMVATLGRPDEAARFAEAALASDPLNGRWWSWLAYYQAGTGRLEEARRSVTKAIELQPDAAAFNYVLTTIEVMEGHADAALAAAKAEPPGIWREYSVVIALQIGGDRAVADAELKRVIVELGDQGALQVAEAYAVRNEPDEMFEWLERAWSTKDVGVNLVLFDPLLVAYEDDPRFAAFCRKVGLPATTTAKAPPIPKTKAAKA